MEYYRRCLIQIFGILEEYEVGTGGQRTLLGPLPDPPEEEEVLKEPPAAATESNSQSAEEQRIPRRSAEEMVATSLLLTAAPTISAEEVKDGEPVVKEEVEVKEEHQEQTEPRPQQASKYDRLPIRVEENGEVWEDVEERWAELSRPNGFISGLLHWKAGGGDSTAHIQTGESAPTDPPAEREERWGGHEGRSQEGGGGGDRQEEEEEGGVEMNLPVGEETPPETQEGKDLEEGGWGVGYISRY